MPPALRRLAGLRAQIAPRFGLARTLASARGPLVPCAPAGAVAAPAGSSGERVLAWMFQKLQLRQDIFLLGPPGPELRALAMRFCELADRECEYVALTRDTSEPELKQRREIVGGSMRYVDQPAVRAALHGRILILEGVEKAERNMLPLLNNLLENREMALDDGRFLLAHGRYDALLAEGTTAAELSARGLVRVHEDFLVVALGLPTATFGGNPLDPPLRSRFQAKTVRPPPAAERAAALGAALGPAHAAEAVGARLVDVADTLRLVSAGLLAPGGAPADASIPWLAEAALPQLARSLRALGADAGGVASGGVARALHAAYPWGLFAPASAAAVARALRRSGLLLPPLAADGAPDDAAAADAAAAPPLSALRLAAVVSEPATAEAADGRAAPSARLEFDAGGAAGSARVALEAVACGARGPAAIPAAALAADLGAGRLPLEGQAGALAELLFHHGLGSNVCLVGGKGSGKTSVARAAALALGLEVGTLFCSKDIASRDLLQRRGTDAQGDTVWLDSPLVQAAKAGRLAVLDGVHRLPPSALPAALGRLLAERAVELPDGSRLVSARQWDALLARGHGAAELAAAGLARVHPAFRVLAIAEPPRGLGGGGGGGGGGLGLGGGWLNAELLGGLFAFVCLPQPSPRELLAKLGADVAGPAERAALRRLLGLSESVWVGLSHEPDLRDQLLSARALGRLGAAALACPAEIDGALLRLLAPRLRAMPQSARDAVLELLGAAGVAHDAAAAAPLLGGGGGGVGGGGAARARGWAPAASAVASDAAAADGSVRVDARGHLLIDGVRSAEPVGAPARAELVPNIEFFNSRRHVALLRAMLADDNARLPLLLLGDQGVGKNKACDRFLQLLRREREYVQLHRDTTVSALTQAPSLLGGKIVWADSALVRAATLGRTLVVDEADKAPLEVVSVLRALVDDGEILLPDGRLLRRPAAGETAAEAVAAGAAAGRVVLPIAPAFRVLVLANRPGYPFLGNNFMRECGDVFATHLVDAPDPAGEASLLQRLAPAAPPALVRKVAGLFAELRALVADGLLAYPYSTREAAHLLRHLEAFPADGLVGACSNVFAFDEDDGPLAAQLGAVLRRHGIPAGARLGADGERNDGGGGGGGGGRFSRRLAARAALPPAEPAELWRLAPAPRAARVAREPLERAHAYALEPGVPSALVEGEVLPGRLASFDEARLRVALPRRPDGKPAAIAALAGTADGCVHALLSDLTVCSVDASAHVRAEVELGPLLLRASRGAADGALLRVWPAGAARGEAEGAGEGVDGLVVFAPKAGTLLALSRGGGGGGGAAVCARAVLSFRLPAALRPPARGASSAAASTLSFLGQTLLGAERAGGGGGAAGGGGLRVSRGAAGGSHWAAWLPRPAADAQQGEQGQQVCVFDDGLREVLTVSLPPPLAACAGGASAAALESVACVDGAGGAWLLGWDDGSAAVLTLADRHGEMRAAGAVDGVVHPLERAALGGADGEAAAAAARPLALRGAALAPGAAAAELGGAQAHGVRLVRAAAAAAPLARESLCDLLEGGRLLAHVAAAAAAAARGARPAARAAEGALLLALRPPVPCADAAADAADGADGALPSPWLAGRARLGALLASLPASDCLVFAERAGGGCALHVLDIEARTVAALSGGGVGLGGADAPPAVAAAALPPSAASGGAEGVVSGHADGSIVWWETQPAALRRSLDEWEHIVGAAAAGGGTPAAAPRATLASANALPTSAPKHGEVDPTGAPHVGGNRWAGGTGGRDTAGLGGRGGPYRLDGGGDVHQLSAALKADVSPAALAAAREMASAAHAARLAEIEMSPHDAAEYARVASQVAREVRQLRNVLHGHEARERARVWLGRQPSGELDDARLVDGIAGERDVYRLRADAPADAAGAPLLKPKLLRFVLDLSGSMYYFNRHDGRLDRQLQTVAMIFEAFAGFERKYRYAVVGHSGDGPCTPFVEYGAPPTDDKARLALLRRMAAHTQYCQSGDNTLNAARAAVAEVLAHDADERFVFVLSDANLARYGVEPADLREAMRAPAAGVEAHALFISSLRDEAAQIRSALPAGRGHICLNAADVPRTFKDILHARALGNL